MIGLDLLGANDGVGWFGLVTSFLPTGGGDKDAAARAQAIAEAQRRAEEARRRAEEAQREQTLWISLAIAGVGVVGFALLRAR